MKTKELLSKLVSINSVFPNEREIGMFIEKYLQKLGFKTQRQYLNKNRFNVLGEKGSGRAILFYGHLDTVPVCKGWTTDPLKPKIEGDWLYGLGSHDMKGGLVAILQAIKEIEPKNFTLKVAFGVDEENISEGVHFLAKSDWLKEVKCSVIPESGMPSFNEHGSEILTLGRRGHVTFKIDVIGKSAHAAGDVKINAVNDGARIILALNDIKPHKHNQLGSSSIIVSLFKSIAKGLSVPEYAELMVEVNTVPPQDEKSVISGIKSVIKNLDLDSKIEVKAIDRKTPFLNPYVISRNNPFVKIVEDVLYHHYDKVIYNYGQSVADECVLAEKGIPVVVIGPAGGPDHAANERVSISSIDKLAEIFKDIINNFSKWEKK